MSNHVSELAGEFDETRLREWVSWVKACPLPWLDQEPDPLFSQVCGVLMLLDEERARIAALEDTIRLWTVNADIEGSYGRNVEAGRIADEIRSRRGKDWPGVTIEVYPCVSPKRKDET